MSWLNEFKAFAMRGNVVDLAVGVIIGASFGKIVSSLVGDVLMPPIGLLLGGVDFNQLKISLSAHGSGGAEVAIKYGTFINTIIDFAIIALVIFLIVKGINSLQKQEPVPVSTKDCPQCAMVIPFTAKKCGHCTSTLT